WRTRAPWSGSGSSSTARTCARRGSRWPRGRDSRSCCTTSRTSMRCTASRRSSRSRSSHSRWLTLITRELEPRQRNSGLRLILAFLVLIADLALVSLIGREEQHLGNPLVGVDPRGERRRVRDLERDKPLPLGLERRDVRDDTTASVGALPHADRQDVTRNAEVFDGTG